MCNISPFDLKTKEKESTKENKESNNYPEFKVISSLEFYKKEEKPVDKLKL